MSGFQRIRGVLIGLVMLIAAFAFIAYPSEDVYITIVTILALGLAIAGIRDIIFYFRMARHMIGGKMILIQGAIIFGSGVQGNVRFASDTLPARKRFGAAV